MEVLIVETEPVIAHAIASALEARGHRLRVARSTADALTQPRPDVVVTDLELGPESGLDLLRELARPGPPPRFVVVTSMPTLESCRQAMRLGAREFLTKPFRLEELIRAVETREATGESFHAVYRSGENLIARGARDLSAFALRAGIGPTCRARIATALGELLENVIEHAYPGSEGTVAVEASVDGRDLVVNVSDRGAGFAGRPVLQNGLDSPKHDGLARAAALAETMHVESRLGLGTRITLRFGSYRVDFDDGESVDLSELDYFAPSTSRQILQTLRDTEAASLFQLSPALAVVIGRFLSAADPKKVASEVLWS